MPVIQYRSTLQQQSTNAQQRINVPDQNGVTRGLAAVSSSLGDFAEKQKQYQDENDANSAMDAFVKTRDGIREKLRGEGGFYTLQGRDAFNGYDKYSEDIDRLGSDGTEGLSDNARKAYIALWQRERESILDGMSRHASDQRQAFRRDVEASIKSDALDEATTAWTNPDRMELALQRGIIAIRAQGSGRPDSAIGEEIEKFQSEFYRSAIQSAMDSENWEAADALNEQYGDKLEGKDATIVSDLVREGGTRRRSQEAADNIMSRGLSQGDALKAARDIDDPEVRDNTVTRIKSRYLEQQAALNADKEDISNQVISYIEDGRKLLDMPLTQQITARQAIGANVYDRVVSMQNGEAVQTDWQRWSDAMQEPDNTTLLEARSFMADAEFSKFSTLKLSDGDQQTSVKRIKTDAALMKEAAEVFGFDTTPKPGTRKAEELSQFYAEATEALENARGEDKNFSDTDAREVLERFGSDVVVKRRRLGFAFDTSVQLSDLSDDDIDSIVVPDTAVNELVDDLLATGNYPDDPAEASRLIKELYIQEKAAGRL